MPKNGSATPSRIINLEGEFAAPPLTFAVTAQSLPECKDIGDTNASNDEK